MTEVQYRNPIEDKNFKVKIFMVIFTNPQNPHKLFYPKKSYTICLKTAMPLKTQLAIIIYYVIIFVDVDTYLCLDRVHIVHPNHKKLQNLHSNQLKK